MSPALRLTAWLLAGALCAGAPAHAQTAKRLTATSSIGTLHAQAQWETPYRRGVRATSMVVAHVAPFELRLAIPAEYLAPPRVVRVYVTLPITAIGMRAPDSLQLTWQTGGRFIPGQIAPGQRTLLYQGIVDGPVLLDQMRFTLRVDGVDVLDRLEIEPAYEIEAQ